MTTWLITKRSFTQLTDASSGSNFFKNMLGFPNLVPHARIVAIILAVVAGLLVLLQLLTGALMAIPASTIMLSVVGLIAVMFIECFMMVYSINCTYTGAMASNNCGAYSKISALVTGIMFILVAISATASIAITANAYISKPETQTEEQARKAAAVKTGAPINTDFAITHQPIFTGMDSRVLDNL